MNGRLLVPISSTFRITLRWLPPCRHRRHAFPTRRSIPPRPFQPVSLSTSLFPFQIPDGPCGPWVSTRGDPGRRGGVKSTGQGRIPCRSGLSTQRSQTTSQTQCGPSLRRCDQRKCIPAAGIRPRREDVLVRQAEDLGLGGQDESQPEVQELRIRGEKKEKRRWRKRTCQRIGHVNRKISLQQFMPSVTSGTEAWNGYAKVQGKRLFLQMHLNPKLEMARAIPSELDGSCGTVAVHEASMMILRIRWWSGSDFCPTRDDKKLHSHARSTGNGTLEKHRLTFTLLFVDAGAGCGNCQSNVRRSISTEGETRAIHPFNCVYGQARRRA